MIFQKKQIMRFFFPSCSFFPQEQKELNFFVIKIIAFSCVLKSFEDFFLFSFEFPCLKTWKRRNFTLKKCFFWLMFNEHRGNSKRFNLIETYVCVMMPFEKELLYSASGTGREKSFWKILVKRYEASNATATKKKLFFKTKRR